MGHSSKKKKRGGGGRRSKGKDHHLNASHSAAENDLSEEITALCSIFQDDCKVVSDPYPQVTIKLRPYSKDTGYDNLDVSALLFVRCLPGYPYKCPKLQITPEKGLSKGDADNLLSLLQDQANANAREGRVMVFNLVEAAQEFLSEIVPVGQSHAATQTSSFLSNTRGPFSTSEKSSQSVSELGQGISSPVGSQPSGRKELPADLFTATYSPTPSPFPGWQTGSPYGMGFRMQYHPATMVPCSNTDNSSQLFLQDVSICNKGCSSKGPMVYGFIDLFSGTGDSWHWGFEMDETRISSSSHAHASDGSKHGYGIEGKKLDKNTKPLTMQNTNQGQLPSPTVKLDALEEEIEDDSESISSSGSSRSLREELAGNVTTEKQENKDFSPEEDTAEEDDGDIESDASESLSYVSVIHDQTSHTVEKDLLMVHLLRLACASKGGLADALPEITTELYNLGIFSEPVRDLATKPSSFFNKTFDHVFRQHVVSSRISQFWKPPSDFGGQSTSLPSSRYLNDFEELQPLGHGGFGHVVLCKNKLDGRQYAVKKIRLKDKSPPVYDRILREVATLSRLQHQHVVRYYQAWFETGVSGSFGDTTWGSMTPASSSFSYKGASSADVNVHENKLESTYLYIQMEYCPRTLRQMFESYSHFNKELAWHLFRQIVEGLAHIHGQGIIHRDLTPNNIFFDARNDIKIGDFGLAKFLKLEQLDQDPGVPPDTTGVSVDRTGQVGTYFYTAPEIEQGWPKIDEKADMYSLGVVFFELWHPFGTAMERSIVLNDLKQKGELPSSWVAEFPEQASLLQHLMSPSPSDRPFATELLQHAFPPRMEYELLDNILRTMQTSEDTGVYDKVVNAIFDKEMLSAKNLQHFGRLRLVGDDTSSIQYTDSDTELRDHVSEVTREVFRHHCAKRLEVVPIRLLDDCPQTIRNTVKLLTHGGDMIELCHELRLPFVNWVITNQKSSFKRYEVSYVYRRAIGHSAPNRYLQGDFDMIGGATALTEAEVIKVAMDIVTHFFHSNSCGIHLNHGDLLEAIWSWIGIKAEHRQKVAELLSMMSSLRPQSPERKLKWVVIRRQLQQELNLAEAVVNRLQTVGLRFCGAADQALPRLRGALPADKPTRKALDELADLFSYLRVWRIEKHVFIDALMPPTESYHRDLFFQIYLMKENNPGSLKEGVLLAIGGRYDQLLREMCFASKSNPPGAVGVSLALETVIQHSSMDIRPFRNEVGINVLVCSRGGGGLLEERMELVAGLWEENIKAEFVPVSDPSLTEQYEYANEHDIKCLVIITDTGVSPTDFVKVRHLELKKEKEVERENLVKFLHSIATQFRNLSIWN